MGSASTPWLDRRISLGLTARVAALMAAVYGWAGLWGSCVGLVPLLLYMLVLDRFLRPSSRRVRGNLVLALMFLAVLAGALTERPATMGNLSWTIVIPMLATLLGNRAEGLVWAAVVLAAQAAVTVLLPLDLFPTFTVNDPLAFQTARFAVITLTALLFARQASKRASGLLRQVREADEAKSVFLANVSHEIRTPIHGILGMTEAMLQRAHQPREHEDLEVVHRSGLTLLKLINDLLDLTKAERGELSVERIPFDLDQLLRDVTRLGEGAAGVRTRLEAEPGGAVLGDPTRLRQVLTNLLSNASKFTSQGEVVVRARKGEEELWTFEVTDTGMGMTPETVAGLFTPFRQADASIARRFGGTGLGLALVKSLTKGMGGRIAVSSELGIGSTFAVTLPLPATALVPDAREGRVPSLEGVRLLVVDDNAINLRVACALLEKLRCAVETAATGEAAVALAAEHTFDAVLMDCQLPGIDGLEATRRLHALAGREAVPVFALTASTSGAHLDRCREAGMAEVLTKPLLFAELCRALGSLERGAPSPPAAERVR
jgi:signal transduction histidine kinase/CheY-like chemotaxis protein